MIYKALYQLLGCFMCLDNIWITYTKDNIQVFAYTMCTGHISFIFSLLTVVYNCIYFVYKLYGLLSADGQILMASGILDIFM